MPIYGPYENYDKGGSLSQPYHFFYHPFDGDVLAYAIKYPVNYDPNQAYPVMIWGGGNPAVGKHYSQTAIDSKQESAINPYDMTHYNNNPSTGSWPWTSTWLQESISECIYIVPRPNDTPNWIKHMPLSDENITSGLEQVVNGTMWKRFNAAVEDLLISIIDNTVIPYKVMDSDTLDCSDIDETYEYPNIDANRIYVGGWSGGAITALGYLFTFKHLIAGVYALAGQIYRAYADSLTPSSVYYNWFSAEHLKVYAKAVAGLPVFVSVANTGMRYDIIALADAVQDACTEHGVPNRFWFMGHNSTGHNYSVEADIPNSSGNRIDTTNHFRQLRNTNPETETNKNPRQLILSFSKDSYEGIELNAEEQAFLSGQSFYAEVISIENTSLDSLRMLLKENVKHTNLPERFVVTKKAASKYTCELKCQGKQIMDVDDNILLDMSNKRPGTSEYFMGVLVCPDYNNRLIITNKQYYILGGA